MDTAELLRVARDEGLDSPVFDSSADPGMDSVVIRHDDAGWTVFISDERGYPMGRTRQVFAVESDALEYALGKLRQVATSARSHAEAKAWVDARDRRDG